MRFALLVAAAAIAHAQAGRDPDTVLQQARAHLQAMAHNLEKYVCVETVNRSYYRRVTPRHAPPRPEAQPACDPNGGAISSSTTDPRQLESTDRVRLEVTVSQGRELHSWPGATRFDARDVDELIRDGPVSTGAFSSYLDSIFSQPEVAFQYTGERTVNGKTVFEYQYHVPLKASRYEVRVDAAWRPAPFEGEFQLDPQTLELQRLTIRTTELPAGASFCQAATTLDYQRVHIGDSDLLLPLQSQLDIVLHSGMETRNVTTFANCREYQRNRKSASVTFPCRKHGSTRRGPGPRSAAHRLTGNVGADRSHRHRHGGSGRSGRCESCEACAPPRLVRGTDSSRRRGARPHSPCGTPPLVPALLPHRRILQPRRSERSCFTLRGAQRGRRRAGQGIGREPDGSRNRNLVLGGRYVSIPLQQEPHCDPRRLRIEVVYLGDG